MRFTLTWLMAAYCSTLLAQSDSPSNRHFWESRETTASPNQIWSIWMDVPNWKNWDTGLKDAFMEDAFQLNARGTIVSLEGRKSKFQVVEFTEGKSYTFRTKLPLGSLYVKRYLETTSGKTVFTHEVWFTGITRGIFASAFGKKFRKMLPRVVDHVKNLAEQ